MKEINSDGIDKLKKQTENCLNKLNYFSSAKPLLKNLIKTIDENENEDKIAKVREFLSNNKNKIESDQSRNWLHVLGGILLLASIVTGIGFIVVLIIHFRNKKYIPSLFEKKFSYTDLHLAVNDFFNQDQATAQCSTETVILRPSPLVILNENQMVSNSNTLETVTQNTDLLNTLPKPLIKSMIAKFLSSKDIINLSSVSKHYYDLLKQERPKNLGILFKKTIEEKRLEKKLLFAGYENNQISHLYGDGLVTQNDPLFYKLIFLYANPSFILQKINEEPNSTLIPELQGDYCFFAEKTKTIWVYKHDAKKLIQINDISKEIFNELIKKLKLENGERITADPYKITMIKDITKYDYFKEIMCHNGVTEKLIFDFFCNAKKQIGTVEIELSGNDRIKEMLGSIPDSIDAPLELQLGSKFSNCLFKENHVAISFNIKNDNDQKLIHAIAIDIIIVNKFLFDDNLNIKLPDFQGTIKLTMKYEDFYKLLNFSQGLSFDKIKKEKKISLELMPDQEIDLLHYESKC